MRRKLEADLARLSSENEELISEFRAADERAKKAVTDVSNRTTQNPPKHSCSKETLQTVTDASCVCDQATRLCEELRQEQERSSHLEKVKKNQEQNLRDLTLRLEEAEQQALKAGKRTIQKLETRVRS